MTEEQAAREAGIPSSHRMKLTSQGTKGFMGNEDYWRFDQLDENGNVVAKWEELDHTAVKGLKQTRTFRKVSG